MLKRFEELNNEEQKQALGRARAVVLEPFHGPVQVRTEVTNEETGETEVEQLFPDEVIEALAYTTSPEEQLFALGADPKARAWIEKEAKEHANASIYNVPDDEPGRRGAPSPRPRREPRLHQLS
jgi:hypothetical protein